MALSSVRPRFSANYRLPADISVVLTADAPLTTKGAKPPRKGEPGVPVTLTLAEDVLVPRIGDKDGREPKLKLLEKGLPVPARASFYKPGGFSFAPGQITLTFPPLQSPYGFDLPVRPLKVTGAEWPASVACLGWLAGLLGTGLPAVLHLVGRAPHVLTEEMLSRMLPVAFGMVVASGVLMEGLSRLTRLMGAHAKIAAGQRLNARVENDNTVIVIPD